MIKNILGFAFLLVLFSCDQKKKKQETVKKENPLFSKVVSFNTYKTINSKFNKEINEWEEYQTLKDFIVKFKNTSPNVALSNALELKDLVVSIKDSVKPSFLDNSAFNTRVNILHNETLRLVDMTYISAITAPQVNAQINKTLDAYSGINAKINALIAQKRFEDEVTIDADYIGIDTTKIDSVSLKSIKNYDDELGEFKKLSKKNKPMKFDKKKRIPFKKKKQ